MYYLYWIRYSEHTDITTEGYVGITTNPSKRLKQHKNNLHNPRVSHALRKGAIMEIVEGDLTKEEVCAKEYKLRPEPNIGWNITEGGGIPPSQKGKKFPGRVISEEQKRRHSEFMKGRQSPIKGRKGHGKGCGTKECEYRGMTFPSRTEAAEYFGVDVSAVTQYIQREGCRRYNQPIFYKGVWYNSINECSSITGNRVQSISTWVRRHPKEQIV